MQVFIIAILISVVLKFLSGIVVRSYISLNKTEQELSHSFFFNLAALIYVINSGLILINGTVLAALAIKTYLL